MKLTDKALEAFGEFLYDKYGYSIFEFEYYETLKNALIIEWFDSVGIYVSIHYETFGNYYFNTLITNKRITMNLRANSITRTEAINEAIVKANEIFNTFVK
jgi:hypothetical protein